MTTPTTEAGRDEHLAWHLTLKEDCRLFSECPHIVRVLAIEAEARQQAIERMQAMRRDYRTLPHAEFPIRWPDWKDYDEVLPTNCSCRDCRLWRSGS